MKSYATSSVVNEYKQLLDGNIRTLGKIIITTKVHSEYDEEVVVGRTCRFLYN